MSLLMDAVWCVLNNKVNGIFVLFQIDGSLLLTNIGVEDAGLYECSVENETAYIDKVNLTVRSKCPAYILFIF